MTLYAFDGASAFDLDAAKRAGGIVCTTYIRGNPGGYNHADAARVAAIRARGMGASPNWESTADFFRTCTVDDARWAGTDALAACRSLQYPDDGSIRCSFSFDYDTNASQFSDAARKVEATTAGMAGHFGFMLYGEQELIDWLCDHDVIDGKHWLMMSTFGQPYHPTSPNVCMVQGHDINGNWIQPGPVPGTDINTVTDPAAVHPWWNPGSPYAGGDDDMTPAERQALIDDIADAVINKTLISGRSLGYRILGANNEIANARADISKITGVALTDAQVQAIAEAVAGQMPGGSGFVITSSVKPL